MIAVDRVTVDRAARCVRNIGRWQGSNVAFCVALAVGVRQFIRFRWIAETRSHEQVAMFDSDEPRIITFAIYR